MNVILYFFTLASIQVKVFFIKKRLSSIRFFLKILKESVDVLDREKLQVKILRLQDKVSGGFSKSIGENADPSSTLSGLAALSLLGNKEVLPIEFYYLQQLIV